MLKKLYLGLIAILGILVFSSYIVYAQVPDELVVHYYRYTNLTDNHHAWVWQNHPASPGGGKDYQFSVEDDENYPKWLVTTVDLTDVRFFSNPRRLGIILKNDSGWGKVVREPGGDRLFTLGVDTEIIDGKHHVYLVQSHLQIYNSRPEVKDTVFSTYFNLSKSITVDASNVGNWKLMENGVEIDSGTSTSSNFTFVPSQTIDITKRYTLEQTFADGGHAVKQVSMEKLYDTTEFTQAFYYGGKLGALYTKEQTTFRVWSPTSEKIFLNLYNYGHPLYDNQGNLLSEDQIEDEPYETIQMERKEKGVFEATFIGDLHGKYYTYTVVNGAANNEIVDPYAFSTGANGMRGMVLDFSKTNPTNWQPTKPKTITNWTDYIIYELHVRDFTTHSTWGGPKELAGTFLGLAQSGTTFSKGDITVSTGLDHIAELGVNAIHILPFFDHGEVDETRLKDEAYMKDFGYNWGYMPLNFNTLEGAYSTNPFDGSVRVKEFKTLVQALHDKGIRVIMDVVYNHTSSAENSNFQYLVPNYYHRLNADGSWSNGSGTGNETASDRVMFRKFMVDSVLFWANEYNLSGFRFDVMGLHDVQTMNDIEKAVNQIDPTIIVYGEPWTAGDTPLSFSNRAVTENMHKINVGSFSDDSREGYKEWVAGKRNDAEFAAKVRYGLAGAAEIAGASARNGHQSFHKEPKKIINYVSVHDGHTLRDFLFLKGKRGDELKELHKLANSLVLLSQGVPFLHGGVDFMHTKDVPIDVRHTSDNGVVQGLAGNSYNMPDRVNQIDYNLKVDNLDIHNHYRSLIAIRRLINSLRMSTATEIQQRMRFLNNSEYDNFKVRIEGTSTSPGMTLIFNGRRSSTTYTLEKDSYIFTDNFGQISVNGLLEAKKGTPMTIVSNSIGIFIDKSDLVPFDPNNKEFPKFYEMDWGLQDVSNENPDDEPIPEPIEQDKIEIAVDKIKISEGKSIPVTIELVDPNFTYNKLKIEVRNPEIASARIVGDEIIVDYYSSGETYILLYDNETNDLLARIHVVSLAPPKTSNLGLILGITIPIGLILIGGIAFTLFLLKRKKEQ
ncbi:MAG: type I pullulanase [Acholeplasmataceae bacterium]